MRAATGIVYNITGGSDMTLSEVNAVSQVVTGLADPSANVIFGAVVDERCDSAFIMVDTKYPAGGGISTGLP